MDTRCILSSSQHACRTNIVRSCFSDCDRLIIGTRLLQHRSTNPNIFLYNQCNMVCWIALQRSTPSCNVTVTIPWSKLKLGATWCNAHMKFAMVGLFVAVVTPSQIVAAAAAVAHTASLKSQHPLAAPAIDISCCAVLAAIGVCTTVRTQTRYSETWRTWHKTL
jgi:hypothetical protein